MWLIFKDAFVLRYLWRKADRAAKEGIFILDEVLTAAHRKNRWTVKHSKVSDLEKEEEEHKEICKKEQEQKNGKEDKK